MLHAVNTLTGGRRALCLLGRRHRPLAVDERLGMYAVTNTHTRSSVLVASLYGKAEADLCVCVCVCVCRYVLSFAGVLYQYTMATLQLLGSASVVESALLVSVRPCSQYVLTNTLSSVLFDCDCVVDWLMIRCYC